MFGYQTAENLLRSGKKVKRQSWAGAARLCLYKNYHEVTHEVEGSVVQLLDEYYGAFWDLTTEDRQAHDWIEV